MDFTLVSVNPGKIFTDRTSIPDVGDIYFIHELSDKPLLNIQWNSSL